MDITLQLIVILSRFLLLPLLQFVCMCEMLEGAVIHTKARI